MSSSSSILIVGTGAMACLFAARFSAAGIPVIMLGTWPEGVAALKSSGVTLVDADGGEHRYLVQAVNSPNECDGMELALVLVKSWQTERAARQLQLCLSPEGRVLSLQNGLGNYQRLVQSLGIDRVFQGVTTVGGTLLSPGRVRSAGEGVIVVGTDPRLTQFVEIFRRANLTIERTTEIESLIWSKLAVNASINPLTAILGVPNGVLLEQPHSRKLMALAASEVAAVAAAQDIQLSFDDIAAAAENVARRTAQNISSMLQDVQRGAPTEIEAINGAVLEIAERTGTPVPVNQSLYLLVKSLIDIKSKKRV